MHRLTRRFTGILLLTMAAGLLADTNTDDRVLPNAATRAQGFYLGAGYAVVYAPDESLGITPPASSATTGSETLWLDYDLGFRATSLSAGYAFRSGVRAELEAGYRRNELEVLDFSDSRGTLNTGASDAVDSFTGFANLYYDFQPAIAVQPYLGAGIGLANTRYKTSFTTRVGFDRVTTPVFNERDTALAWQVIAGASIPFTARSRLSAEYRYWQTANIGFTDDSGASYSTRHKLHMAGLKLQFFPGRNHDVYNAHPATTHSSHSGSLYGLYVAARAGVLAAEDSDLDDTRSDLEDTNFDAFDLGPAGALALGYAFDPERLSLGGWPLRAELEVSVFDNAADVVDFGKLPGEFRLDGEVGVRALALNVLAERHRRRGLTPYAGIGIGYANVDYNVQVLGADTTGQVVPDGRTTLIKDSDDSVTVQGLLGVSVALRNNRHLSLGYRYWWAPILRLRGPAGERQKTEHSAHAIHIGLRFSGLGGGSGR